MPRTLQEIIDHADEIAQAFEDYEPNEQDRRPAAPLRHAREAVQARAKAEQAVAHSVNEMREAGYTWTVIGSLLGTSAEAARQRYGVPTKQVAVPMTADAGSAGTGFDAGESRVWTDRDDEQLLNWIEQGVTSTARQQRTSAPDRHRAVVEALAELPERDRTLLAMLVSDPPVKHDEISKLLGISPRTIRTTRARLLTKLRQHPSIRAIYDDNDRPGTQ